MWKYLLFIISLSFSIAALFMYHEKNKPIIRVLGILIAYIASAIALKIFFMISPP
ncbi:MAG: hypothetical protein Kow0042_28850 [Calditrichia bacterium]